MDIPWVCRGEHRIFDRLSRLGVMYIPFEGVVHFLGGGVQFWFGFSVPPPPGPALPPHFHLSVVPSFSETLFDFLLNFPLFFLEEFCDGKFQKENNSGKKELIHGLCK